MYTYACRLRMSLPFQLVLLNYRCIKNLRSGCTLLLPMNGISINHHRENQSKKESRSNVVIYIIANDACNCLSCSSSSSSTATFGAIAQCQPCARAHEEHVPVIVFCAPGGTCIGTWSASASRSLSVSCSSSSNSCWISPYNRESLNQQSTLRTA